MLNILHSKINSVVPIIGIQKNDNEFVIEYENSSTITAEQISQVNDIIENWPIDHAKIIKAKQLDLWWNNQINNGFETSYGWRLGLRNDDIVLLSGAFLLAKEASSLGLSQEAIIMDNQGVSHTISINDFTILMLQYGGYRSQLSLNYSNKKKEIEDCVSITQIDEIII